MGAGKSTVGNALAQRLNWQFHDLDQLIEKREQRSIAAIFSDAGESGFRKVETAALKDLLEQGQRDKGSVVALGGGAFVQTENRDLLQRSGAIIVLLTAPLEELRRRCREKTSVRPLAQDKKMFDELFADRQAAYSLADFKVETGGKQVHEVAREIEEIVKAAIAG